MKWKNERRWLALVPWLFVVLGTVPAALAAEPATSSTAAPNKLVNARWRINPPDRFLVLVVGPATAAVAARLAHFQGTSTTVARRPTIHTRHNPALMPG